MVLTPSQIYIAEVSSIRMAPVLNASTSFFVSLGFIVITLLGYVIKVGNCNKNLNRYQNFIQSWLLINNIFFNLG